jgi:pimeloyl-ACP methyl ester carboxylesterase
MLGACAAGSEKPEPDGGGASSDAATAPGASAEEPVGEIVELTVGDLTFRVRVAGPETGQPVLLLHGFPETSLEWSAQINFLAEHGYRVVAPDQRGYSPGARPTAVADYAMLQLVRDVTDIADALGIERFHLVGHDWGASVVWATAFVAPQRLLSIVPISVPHLDAFSRTRNDPTSCQPAASTYIDEFVTDGFEAKLLRDDSAELRRLYHGLPASRVAAYLAHFRDANALQGPLNWYRANLATKQSPAIGKTSVPTMYIWSDLDESMCRDGAELTAEYVSAPYQFEILEGVNHWVPELAADDVNALLLEHLRSFASTGGA